MPFASYLHAARTQWPILALSTVLGGAGLGSLQLAHQPTYRAETVVSVTFIEPVPSTTNTHGPTPTPRTGPTLPPETQDRRTARQVTTYTQLASTTAVARSAIATLHLPYTPSELGQKVVAFTPFDSDTINIAVTDADPHRAADIANVIAAELSALAAVAEIPAGETQPVLAVSRRATAPAEPEPVTWTIPLASGALAGFALGIAIAVFRRNRATVSAVPAPAATPGGDDPMPTT